MICKFQLPVTPPGAEILVYNQTRSFNRFMDQRDAVKYFRPGEIKFYAEVDWTTDGKIRSLRRLSEQKW